MNKIRCLLVAAVSGVAGVVIFQNRGMVKTEVLSSSFELPLILLLGGMAAAGFVVGYLVSVMTRTGNKE